ncbi:MAG: hypothetical protein ACTS4Z_00110 [Candidatus Hodgkinia cicadicola]
MGNKDYPSSANESTFAFTSVTANVTINNFDNSDSQIFNNNIKINA